jgi:hypothetical protein
VFIDRNRQAQDEADLVLERNRQRLNAPRTTTTTF